MSDHAEKAVHDYKLFEEHIVPLRTYLTVFIVLLCATALTTWIAFQDLGNWNVVVAVTIAVCKASLVALFFMHLRYNKGLSRIVAIAAIFWLGIMMTFTLADELSRHWEINPQPWAGAILPMVRHLFF